MSNNNEISEITPIIDMAQKYKYKTKLISHWVDSFGLDKTQEYLKNLRKPYNSIWVQVNTSKVDFFSLIQIFEDMGFKVNKNSLFEDFIEVKLSFYDLSEEKEELPSITVDRESASIIYMGKDVTTAAISAFDDFEVGEKIRINDPAQNLMAIGIAKVKSNEIDSLSQRLVAKNVKSWAQIPPITEMREYRRGLFNILDPIQAIGVNSLYSSKKDNILVMSPDKGDVAAYIAELTQHKTPITVIARNSMQLKAIAKNLKRVKSKAIRVIKSPFLRFLKERHDIKYTSIYLEPPNSRSAIIPAFSSILTIERLQQLAKHQHNIIKNIFRSLHTNASISYVTHSLDVLENEEVFKKILEKAYYIGQSFPKKIRELQLKGKISSRMELEQVSKLYEKENHNSTIFYDPVQYQNIGGFVAKFKLKSKR